MNAGAGKAADTGRRHLFRRGPWENAAGAVIGVGVCMLMQPFFMPLYTWSFLVILAGTAGFLIANHFPEQ